MEKIAVIGCGHGGQALAGHMASLGHSVNLYASKNHPGGLKAIQKTKKIKCIGAVKEEGKIALCTHNLEDALKDVRIIFIALPVTAHDAMFIHILPFLEEHQIIINLSAHFSGIFQYEILKKVGWERDILIADITSFPYACRIQSQGTVNILAIKKKVGLAARNIKTAQKIKKLIKNIFPSSLDIKSSFIEAGLYDPSGITHPPTAIFNAGRIGNGDEFYFYKDGTSDVTASYLEQIDDDRVEIAKRLGFKIPNYPSVMNEYYGSKHKEIFEFFKTSPVHNQEKLCPKSMDHRYITEDVPYSLVPWYTLGLCVDYVSSAMKNIIDISSILHEKDYLELGRNLTNEHITEYKKCG